jgi:hypothetical protein
MQVFCGPHMHILLVNIAIQKKMGLPQLTLSLLPLLQDMCIWILLKAISSLFEQSYTLMIHLNQVVEKTVLQTFWDCVNAYWTDKILSAVLTVFIVLATPFLSLTKIPVVSDMLIKWY